VLRIRTYMRMFEAQTGSEFFDKVDWSSINALEQSVVAGKLFVRKVAIEEYL
jgi:hypothetical protein